MPSSLCILLSFTFRGIENFASSDFKSCFIVLNYIKQSSVQKIFSLINYALVMVIILCQKFQCNINRLVAEMSKIFENNYLNEV